MKDYDHSTVLPYIEQAAKELGNQTVGPYNPAVVATGLQPVSLSFSHVRQAARIDPELRAPYVNEEIDKHMMTLKIAHRALELLQAEARKELGVAASKPAAARAKPREPDARDDNAVGLGDPNYEPEYAAEQDVVTEVPAAGAEKAT